MLELLVWFQFCYECQLTQQVLYAGGCVCRGLVICKCSGSVRAVVVDVTCVWGGVGAVHCYEQCALW